MPLPLHLIEELNHRVMNEFAEAISMLSVAAHAKGGSPRAVLERAAVRLRAHAEAHRSLMAPEVSGSVNLAQYIRTMCGALAQASLADRGVQLTLRADDVFVATDRCWRIGLVIAELIRNASRHGLAGGAGAVVVCLRTRCGVLSCLVGDSGRGNPEAREGRGTLLVRSIIAELGGSVEWCFSPRGSVVRLEVPAPEAVPA